MKNSNQIKFNDYDFWIEKGDCLDFLKTIPDESVDLIISDPPYIIDKFDGDFANKDFCDTRKYLVDLNNKKETLRDGFNIKEVLDECRRIQGKGKENLYLFCNAKLLRELLAYYKKDNIDVLIWHKNNPPPMFNLKYLSDIEYILYVCNNRRTLQLTYETARKVFNSNIVKKETDHPTEKPLFIIDRLVENSCRRGDVVLDMFMGSGSTIKSALQLDRKAIGFEIDDEYYQLAQRRLKVIQKSLF